MTLYQVLGLEKEATLEEIKTVYRELVKQYHPDVQNLNLSEEEKHDQTERFKLVQKAYEVLSDPERRKLYDDTGYHGEKIDEEEELNRMVVPIALRVIRVYIKEPQFVGVPFKNYLSVEERESVSNFVEQKRKVLQQQEKLRRIISRIRKSPKNDFLRDTLESEIKDLSHQLESFQNQQKLMEQAYKLCREYDIAEENPWSNFGYSYTSSGSAEEIIREILDSRKKD